MKNFAIKKLLFALAALFLVLSCQRDDICPASTQTTPLLIIRFYDADEPEETQPPVNLSVREVNNDTLLLYRVNLDSIAIPLRTNRDLAEYEFIFNANEIDEEDDEEQDDDPLRNNADIITFSYATEERYINRACAYKVNFLNIKPNVDSGDDTGWIQRIRIDQIDVEDETSSHISVFY